MSLTFKINSDKRSSFQRSEREMLLDKNDRESEERGERF